MSIATDRPITCAEPFAGRIRLVWASRLKYRHLYYGAGRINGYKLL